MLTDYNPQDAKRLQQARLERFQPFLLGLSATVAGDSLQIQASNPEFAIAQTNILLHQAAIILGTSRLEIRSNNSLVLVAELKSEQIHKSEEAMTATAVARSVEFDIEPKQQTQKVIPYSKIIGITGEKEAQLRDRLKASGTPFYWIDEDWGVDEGTATQLVVQFRAEQGRREAAMLLGEQEPAPSSEKRDRSTKKQPAAEESNGHKPKAEKPEFRPLKKGAGPTLEKYLSFTTDNEARQAEILKDISEEGSKSKRHVNKILGSYPEDMDKPKPSEFYAAAKRLMAKRSKGQTDDSPAQEATAE